MTITEAAQALGVTPSTLRNQIAKKKLRAEQIGKFWVLRPAEVERYRSEHLGQHKGGPKPGKKR